jgi:ABC-2 type transport system permease protein
MASATSAPPVPWLLVRLKALLTFNRIRTTKGGAMNAVLAALIATVVGLFVAAAVGSTAGANDTLVPQATLVLGACVLLAGWTVFPLLTFGSDETLDVARLQLFPMQRNPLMIGLLASAFVGFAPLAAVIVVVGAVLGFGRGVGLGVVIVAAAGLAVLLLSAATARMVTTLLASRLTSRRGRDATIIIVSVLALAAQGLRFVRFTSVDRDVIERAVDILRWTPPGMLGQSMFDASEGSYGLAVLELIVPVAFIPAALAVWANALDRSLTVVTGGSTSVRRNRRVGATGLKLLFDRLSFVRPDAVGAVAARELRYVGREPRRKVVLMNSVLLGLGVPIWLAITSRGLSPGTVLLGSAAGYIAILSAMNQFGFDGGAMWMDIVAGNRVREQLVGRNLALSVQVLPIIAGAGIVLAAISGGWLFLPAAFALGAAGLGVGLAVADVVSVRFPQRLPESRSPFAGAAAGQGCGKAFILMMCFIVQWILLVPVGAGGLVVATVGPTASLVVIPLVLGYGALLWRTGVNMATQWAFWHQPELLAAVDPGKHD